MAAVSTLEQPVSQVQIDGLVALKIVKHCEEEGGCTGELVQGVLLGLVEKDTLEITNCFPFPKHTDDEDFDDEQYQMDMMRNLRHVNIDHLHVGWYQSTHYGTFLNKELLDSQYNYQHSIEESVVLIYDPIKTTKGSLSLKAYRLTAEAMETYRERDFSPESTKKNGLTYEKLFEEIPVNIRNSHLINIMLCELEEQSPPSGDTFLNLATGNVLEKNMELLMDCLDDINQETIKFLNYQRTLYKMNANKHQQIYKRKQENEARAAKGQPPLPEEDLSKQQKAPIVPSRLDSLLISGQMKKHCDEISRFATQSFGKLFMAEALQPKE
ncbi:eukaryotic translation initiation factor 3 subunit H-like [Anneissia japonica]|uniref:eukaryotic translation initiation factor 3 subunit H-like n=1 Tax=Anneissia japonica TaxID=1529436 RepID=UPI0014259898|nr:eukaryotic translation initiation factor 3 subunit H-like [Anneissia japonica]